jgi:hypothetical protein
MSTNTGKSERQADVSLTSVDNRGSSCITYSSPVLPQVIVNLNWLLYSKKKKKRTVYTSPVLACLCVHTYTYLF